MSKVPELSIFFFDADATAESEDPSVGKYDLLLESAQFADENGFTAVWTPERHFQKFGGLYGNASVTSAAVAVLTRRIGIRAGSVVLPLQQHALRVAEEWSMIDHLSKGRVGIAVASGFHVNDFVLAPGNFERRREDLADKIEQIQRLWRGETLRLPNGAGVEIEVGIRPLPIQKQLPMWITANSDASFVRAGELGFSVLTASFSAKYDIAPFLARIALYRETIQKHHGTRGHVTMMAHSYVGADQKMVDEIARPAMTRYIGANLELQKEQDLGKQQDRGYVDMDKRREAKLVGLQVNTNIDGPLSFIGTPERCASQARFIRDNGVDEIACLIDFGIDKANVLASLRRMAALLAEGTKA